MGFSRGIVELPSRSNRFWRSNRYSSSLLCDSISEVTNAFHQYHVLKQTLRVRRGQFSQSLRKYGPDKKCQTRCDTEWENMRYGIS